MNCINCGNALTKLDEWKFRDGSIICYDCCEKVLMKNEEASKKKFNFYKNLCVLSYEDFKEMDDNPELVQQCVEDEMLPVSPFKEFEKKYILERVIHFGRWRKYNKSALLDCGTYMEISKVSQSLIGKRVVVSEQFNYSDVVTAKVSYKPSKWQFMLACLAAISIPASNVIGVLLTLLLLWMSHGYEVQIKLRTGRKICVPTKRKKEQSVTDVLTLLETRQKQTA